MPELDYLYQPYVSVWGQFVIKNERKKTLALIHAETIRFYKWDMENPRYERVSRTYYEEFEEKHRHHSLYTLYKHYLWIKIYNDKRDKYDEDHPISKFIEKLLDLLARSNFMKWLVGHDYFAHEKYEDKKPKVNEKKESVPLQFVNYKNINKDSILLSYCPIFHEEGKKSMEENINLPNLENIYEIKRNERR